MQNLNQSPSCKKCIKTSKLVPPRLCDKCEAYVNQHYGGGKENLTLGSDLENTDSDTLFWEQPPPEDLEVSESKPRQSFNKILTGTTLTRREKFVLKLHFVEGLTFEAIAKRLRISPTATSTQYYRALTKLREQKAGISKVTHEVRDDTSQDQTENGEKKVRCLPVRHYRPDEFGKLTLQGFFVQNPIEFKTTKRTPGRIFKECPRCGAQAFCVDDDLQYCMDCLWTSDTDGDLSEPGSRSKT